MANRNRRSYNSYNSNYRKNGYSSKRKRSRNSSTSPSALKSLAYRLGLVNRGLKNPDSALHESYQKGLEVPPKKNKKTLF